MGVNEEVPCICQGNWRNIVNKVQPMLGQPFNDRDGKVHTFFGVVHGDDDYYYGMWRREDRRMVLLSCVGDLDAHGYTPVLTD